MAKKLFRVSITYYAAADDAASAVQSVDIDRSAVAVDDVTEITYAGEIDPEWAGCFPFGADADDDRTCAEYFEEVVK